MYENLMKRLRDKASALDYDGWVDTAASLEEAADAIEELLPFKKQVEKGMGLLDKADELLNVVKPRWIPVTEGLPEKDGTYLVCGRWRGKPIEIWVCESITLGPIKGWANMASNPVISHWMPIPEPLKEEE